MKNTLFVSSLGIFCLFLLFSCGKEQPDLAAKAPVLDASYDYTLKVPNGFLINGNFAISPEQNSLVEVTNTGIVVDFEPGFNNFGFGFNSANPTVTNKGAALGRVLFYDPKLSLNNAVSCASCHKQNLAFSDDKAESVGFGGKRTPRNSMAIVNPAFNTNLFWDSRSSSVMDLVTKPIQNHIEMGIEDMQALSKKLSETSYYPELFKEAYGDSHIYEERISDALAQFVCSMSSVDSKFDRERAQNFAGFTPLESQGMALFNGKANCSGCHSGSNFAAADFPGGEYGGSTFGNGGRKGTANIGLNLVYNDPGMTDGNFRIPSLRNIALTAPYMHDGRFANLEEVVEHYNSHVAAHPNLDEKLKGDNGMPQRLNLNTLEKKALIAFLGTLTDETLVKDPKFSNPFK